MVGFRILILRENKMMRNPYLFVVTLAIISSLIHSANGQSPRNRRSKDPRYAEYGIYENTAKQAEEAAPRQTDLPLKLQRGDRIAFIGNTLFERAQLYGFFETRLYQSFPQHDLIVRNLSWAADTVDQRPRPANFATLEQHLTHESIDIVLAAFGFNESFAGKDGVARFSESLEKFLRELKTHAYNGKSSPQIVLISPIANENVSRVRAADLNNQRIEIYVEAMKKVAAEQHVGFVNLFDATKELLKSPGSTLTSNGVHLNEEGYDLFSQLMFKALFSKSMAVVNPDIRRAVVDKNRQYFRRYRPLNTFYYTGGRNQRYGYLDFLPAMRNFDLMVSNREQRIWKMARGEPVGPQVDDSNVPPLPETEQSRGANRWVSSSDELKSFKIDPRFEVNLFASEEQFPDIAAPIQMRWDTKGRLWMSCSTTYPHVYPGNEPNDKLVILEDTDGDGRADKSSVFADDLHIPLSFEFGDGGVYVSEMPDLTFIKDTDGDGKADLRQVLLSGFGTEDSHHALHDFTWTPDGDLLFREGIFHHSQVETPYGPVRQANSGWFRFQPRTHRLTSLGTYHSTNPWGVAFDAWGQHVASHPIYAEAFHSLDPPYPQQHPRPGGLRAYSGTCGQEFVDFPTFPSSLQGGYIKARYKPTNRIEIHRWKEQEFGFDEEYVSDLIFSTNLSFIPVDIRFGPRGALYVCDWYNPIKGHAQYSLRDERRDRHSGRIWRITTKGLPLQECPTISGAPIEDLLEILKRPEYRYRYWAKLELRDRDPREVGVATAKWLQELDRSNLRFRQQQLEGMWLLHSVDQVDGNLLRDLFAADQHLARAAAIRQLRYWHPKMDDAVELLKRAANDPSSIVRMQAAIAATYVGTKGSLDAMLETLNHPHEKHLAYAIQSALHSQALRRHWEGDSDYPIAKILRKAKREQRLTEPPASASQAQFDSQDGLKLVEISCLPERMKFTLEQFDVKPNQPVKLVFMNPDATDHNLLIVKPNALEEVGMAANEMAKNPRFANSNFHPKEKGNLILQASPMIGPTRRNRVHVMRFNAPAEPGVYPYVCTFPGHWVIMKGVMIVAENRQQIDRLLAAQEPKTVKAWTVEDFEGTDIETDERTVMRGMRAFQAARCDQCHRIGSHGTKLGPDLGDVAKRFQGQKLLRQIIEPSVEIHKDYQTYLIERSNGQIISGIIQEDVRDAVTIIPNLLAPQVTVRIPSQEIESRTASRVSSMPVGMLNSLTKEEILDLLGLLHAGGYQLPDHLKRHHQHD